MPVVPKDAFDPRPITAPRDTPGKDIIYPEQYRHAVVDSKQQIYSNLLTNLPGMKWRGWLYTQVKGKDEAYMPFDRHKALPLQQYKLIKDYELLLQGNLSTSIDQVTGEVKYSGTVLTYPSWMVNYGDVWIADIGEGKAGLFTVTEVTKKTMFKESVYELQLSLVEPMTDALAGEIAQFVQQTYVFQRDFMRFGQNPYLIEDEYQNKLDLEKLLAVHQEIYVNSFINWQTKSFMVPEPKSSMIYDPFIVRMITGTIDLMQYNLLTRMSRYNVSDFGIEDTNTLFECLLDRKPEMLSYGVMRKARLISTKNFTPNVRFGSIAFSGYRYVVAPNGGSYDKLNPTGGGVLMVPTTTDPCGCDPTPWNDVLDLDINVGGGGQTVSDGTEGTVLPNIHSDAYILSAAFYDRDMANMTKFERLLWDGMEKATVNASDVIIYYKSWSKWSIQDKFYLTPLLFILTQYALRSLYD